MGACAPARGPPGQQGSSTQSATVAVSSGTSQPGRRGRSRRKLAHWLVDHRTPCPISGGRFRHVASWLAHGVQNLPVDQTPGVPDPQCATRRLQERRRAWPGTGTSAVATRARWSAAFPGPPTGKTARITVPARRNPERRRTGSASLDYRARRDSAGAPSGGNRGVRTRGAGRLAVRSLKAFCKRGLWSALRTCGICDAKRPAGSRLVDESCTGDTEQGTPDDSTWQSLVRLKMDEDGNVSLVLHRGRRIVAVRFGLVLDQ